MNNTMNNTMNTSIHNPTHGFFVGSLCDPLTGSLRSDVLEESWRCATCQYLNVGGERCAMCNVRREEKPEEPRPEPVVKKSVIGQGMKLKKTVEVRMGGEVNGSDGHRWR